MQLESEFIGVKEPPPLQADTDFDKKFRPKGAIAFFILLVILGLIIWFGIYFLMLDRV